MSHRRSLLMKRPSSGFAFNNALSFDGINDYVATNISTTTTNTWTFSIWFKYNSLLGMIGTSSTANRQYCYFPDANTIRFNMGALDAFTVPTMSSGTWYHLMVTNNLGGKRLYLNGVESSSGTLSAGTFSSRMDWIGRNFNGTVYWDGLLDEAIYETSTVYGLTDAQNLYNSGSGVASDSIITNPDWYYKFDESGTATTAVDSSGNGNNGTLTNFPTSGMWVAH